MDHRKAYSWEGVTSCGAGYSNGSLYSRPNVDSSSARNYDISKDYSSPDTKYETN